MCYTEYPFFQTILLTDDSLLWLETTGFCYTISTGFVLEFISDVVALCHGDAIALDLKNQHLHVHQQFIHGVDVGVGQL